MDLLERRKLLQSSKCTKAQDLQKTRLNGK